MKWCETSIVSDTRTSTRSRLNSSSRPLLTQWGCCQLLTEAAMLWALAGYVCRESCVPRGKSDSEDSGNSDIKDILVNINKTAMAPPPSARPAKMTGMDHIRDSRQSATFANCHFYNEYSFQARQGDGNFHWGQATSWHPRSASAEVFIINQ